MLSSENFADFSSRDLGVACLQQEIEESTFVRSSVRSDFFLFLDFVRRSDFFEMLAATSEEAGAAKILARDLLTPG